jgi:adenylate kinase family enzyme
MIVVNLFGAPGAGKSTGAAYVFSKLKLHGVNAELVTEYAKDKVWEGSSEVFKNQAYIFGKQYYRISRLDSKVDVVVTDSPILNSALYNDSALLGSDFDKVVRNVFDSYENINYYVSRDKPYNPAGRHQTQDQSDRLAKVFRQQLSIMRVPYRNIKGNQQDYDRVVSDVLNRLHNPPQKHAEVDYE